MFLNNYHHLKNKEIYILIFLILFSIFIRVPIISVFGDINIENEWGIIFKNLITNGQLIYEDSEVELSLPNLWMPPLYAYYIYFFSIFSSQETNVTQLILYSQAFLASISVAIFYKLNKLFFSQKISFYSSLIFSIFPLHAYACSQISSISLQTFLTILFFYFFFKVGNEKRFSSIIFFSLTGGLLMLLRGESIAIIFLSIIYLFIFFKIPVKQILLILLITLMTISPYLTRNFLIFDKIIIIKSFGYNFWR